jgi:hypothetical protein
LTSAASQGRIGGQLDPCRRSWRLKLRHAALRDKVLLIVALVASDRLNLALARSFIPGFADQSYRWARHSAAAAAAASAAGGAVRKAWPCR